MIILLPYTDKIYLKAISFSFVSICDGFYPHFLQPLSIHISYREKNTNKSGSRRRKKVVSARFWNFLWLCFVWLIAFFFSGHLFGSFHCLHVFLCLFFVCPSLSLFTSLFLSPILIFSLPFSLSLSLSLPFSHVTRGYNIVADRWTEASNPHPHPNLNP